MISTTAVIDRLAVYFSEQQTRQGLLARAELGRPSPGDPELACRMVGLAAAQLRADGSVGGAPVTTIWRAHELLDLGSDPTAAPLALVLRWMMELQEKPGGFGEGCDRERHSRRLCEHFVIGFFAPAPPELRLAPVTLPNGKVYRAEPAARFALSCLALRAALRAGHRDRSAVRSHVTSLVCLAEQWTTWTGYFAPDLIVAALHALVLAGEDKRPVVQRLTSLVAAHQGEDGVWPTADLFHVLEALCAVGSPAALAAVRRAVPALAERQRPDGTFGFTAQQERALIALRAIQWADAGL
ncbi:MAG: hypothetical protein ACAI18_08635 [Gemmatimonadales bacterium]